MKKNKDLSFSSIFAPNNHFIYSLYLVNQVRNEETEEIWSLRSVTI
jgi:hypothetical protein